MLVLSRKPGEAVAIGDQVTVHVQRLQCGRVVLAFDAPRDVRIRRAEQLPRDVAQQDGGQPQ